MKNINLLPKAPARFAKLLSYQRKLTIIAAVVLAFFIQLLVSIWLIEQFVVVAKEKRVEEEMRELTATIATYKDRQALLITINRQLDTLAPLISQRFAYERIFNDLNKIIPPNTHLLEFVIDSAGQLSFAATADDYQSIETLISSILDFNFSPSFSYTLQDAKREGDGSYLLRFYFKPKTAR